MTEKASSKIIAGLQDALAHAQDLPYPWERPLGNPQRQDRDLDVAPYDRQERRVAKILFNAGAGGGDDPIGFLLASSAWGATAIKTLRQIALLPKDATLEQAQTLAMKTLNLEEL